MGYGAAIITSLSSFFRFGVPVCFFLSVRAVVSSRALVAGTVFVGVGYTRPLPLP